MENKIGKDFESLFQRILYGYVGTLPAFVPVSYRWTCMDEEITSNKVRFQAFADDAL